VKPGRIPALNVEIMATLLLDAVGNPRGAFTFVMAVGRSAGWLAHAVEQRKTGRMIRPVAAYAGSRSPGSGRGSSVRSRPNAELRR
jgi:citrate synthase